MQKTQIIEGTIGEIVFRNETNGYTVCLVNQEEEEVTAVGCLPFINPGETVRLTGGWMNHPDYGMQFKVSAYETVPPQTADAMAKYLSSGVIKGIGPITAARITGLFGDDSFRIISSYPERLTEIRGINYEKALVVSRSFNEQNIQREVVIFFQRYGLSPASAMKAYNKFGADTVNRIKENPYLLAETEYRIGFAAVDKIAMSLGTDPLSQNRIRSGVEYVLKQAASEGHTYVPEDVLLEYSGKILTIGPDDIENAYKGLLMDDSVRIEREAGNQGEEGALQPARVYLRELYDAENCTAHKLTGLIAAGKSSHFRRVSPNPDLLISSYGLSGDQAEAVLAAASNPVMVITGGPGTGKTTIIKAIIDIFHKQKLKVALAAPTGRAAKKMSEAAGHDAGTVHRLLEIGYIQEGGDEPVFVRDEDNPIDADAIIIDEMSMMDICLMSSLLKAIKPGSRLIMSGDADQLPSVGAGNVLKDIVASGTVKVSRLTEIFRQAAESMIIVNAHRINKGEYPHLNHEGGDFFFVRRNNQSDIVETVINLVAKRLPESYGLDPVKHIQVLSPMKKGDAGVVNLNIRLQAVLNPPVKGKREILLHGFTYREGDRVMQIRNNYTMKWVKAVVAGAAGAVGLAGTAGATGKTGKNSEKGVAGKMGEGVEGLGVFNGDSGVISRIDNENQTIEVLFDDDRASVYEPSNLEELSPAYAISIHKSQGSEFPAVVIPIFPGPPVLLTRNLLYTAVTRARDLAVLVGREDVLASMLDNIRETARYSALDKKLAELAELAELAKPAKAANVAKPAKSAESAKAAKSTEIAKPAKSVKLDKPAIKYMGADHITGNVSDDSTYSNTSDNISDSVTGNKTCTTGSNKFSDIYGIRGRR